MRCPQNVVNRGLDALAKVWMQGSALVTVTLPEPGNDFLYPKQRHQPQPHRIDAEQVIKFPVALAMSNATV